MGRIPLTGLDRLNYCSRVLRKRAEGEVRAREKITGTTPLIERYSVRDAAPSDPPEVSDAEGVAP